MEDIRAANDRNRDGESKEALGVAMDMVKEKLSPIKREFIPESTHVHLYKLLQVFEDPSIEIDNQVKFIKEFFKESKADPVEGIIKISKHLGKSPSTEKLVSRVYRYCRLQGEAEIALQHFRNIRKQMGR